MNPVRYVFRCALATCPSEAVYIFLPWGLLEFTRGEVRLGADVLDTGAARLRKVRLCGYPDHALERVYEQHSNETGVVCARMSGGRSASMSGHT